MGDKNEYLDIFYEFSEYLTGYSKFEIYGTGIGNIYFDTIMNSIGKETFVALLNKFYYLIQDSKGDDSKFEEDFYKFIFFSDMYGSITKNITKLWFTGYWTDYNANESVVSKEAYLEAFVWRDFGAHPMGGKPGGFGSWSTDPSAEL